MKEKHWFEVMNARIAAWFNRTMPKVENALLRFFQFLGRVQNKIIYAWAWATGVILLEKGLAKLLRKKKDLSETGELIYRLQVICLLASVLFILIKVMEWTSTK